MIKKNQLNILGENITKICGMGSTKCYKKAQQHFYSFRDLIQDDKIEAAFLFRDKCNCLPACNMISYNADIDRTKFDWSGVNEQWKSKSTYVKYD